MNAFTESAQKLAQSLNRLAKWRTILAGWQLGTREQSDPESEAVRDHREATLFQRAELSAVSNLLIEKGVFTEEELQEAITVEAELLSQMLSDKFPGFTANDHGMTIDAKLAAQTTKGWKP